MNAILPEDIPSADILMTVLESTVQICRSKIFRRCPIALRYGDWEGHNILIYITFILLKPFSELSTSVVHSLFLDEAFSDENQL